MITFELITPQGVSMNEQVHEIVLPTRSGQIGVLSGHEHLVSITTEGVIALRRHAGDPDSSLEYLAVSRDGVIEVTSDHVLLLADDVERSDEVDEKETKSAYEKAQKMVADAKDKQSLDQAMASLDRYAVRLKISELKHRRMRS